jgi:hypothetical protein
MLRLSALKLVYHKTGGSLLLITVMTHQLPRIRQVDPGPLFHLTSNMFRRTFRHLFYPLFHLLFQSMLLSCVLLVISLPTSLHFIVSFNDILPSVYLVLYTSFLYKFQVYLLKDKQYIN